MKIRNYTLLPLSLPLLAFVNATPRDDMINLTASIANVSVAMMLALDEVAAVNTSGLLQRIGYEMGASMANLGCTEQSPIPSSNATNTTLSTPYQNYTSSLSALSTTLISLGHNTPDTPSTNPQILLTIQSLTRAIYSYGKCLYTGAYISQANAIETWTVGGEILEAEVAWTPWDMSDRLRGERKRRRESVRVEKVRRSGRNGGGSAVFAVEGMLCESGELWMRKQTDCSPRPSGGERYTVLIALCD